MICGEILIGERYLQYSIAEPLRIKAGQVSNATAIGRLEILYNGVWGTICDDSWDLTDAEVACRQLGYDHALKALQGKHVDDGTGQIWLDDVGCYGHENSLSSCAHNGWGTHNCAHCEDAGVECSKTGN